ncbi:DegT/DnrJ/EryC1/StrS family aminotransferase [Lentzea albidocapillata]|uniref:dTDP-4-amino-4,6-dideoxygalactose transaminase n=1 Tax=Lentzea albidocapillata TaxID=40571 RepID=A0A1W2CVC3_9PSEU|nr:DegT/DnrJ/EryC1/StrS family aminotransferase [Lentzea albidocapillata]SMC88906.1 dTDP-4-amino-4,6-dideoxygalactose transaminase [Lentzea albidocapillata]
MTTTEIPHPAEWPVYDESVTLQVADLVRSGRTFDYRHGQEIRTLEDQFSALHENRHALAVNSGTSALFAAYHSLGIEPGDEVLVPASTFLATASPLFLLGAVPVLCDSGESSGNVTAATLRSRLTPRTKAIVVTHLFGCPCPMDEIMRFAREVSLPVVEDCSHAHGSTYRGRPVGVFGDLAAFSIGGLKLVSGGMGGILLARERRHHEIACLLTSFQQRSQITVTDPGLRGLADVGLGGNLRITPMAAVLATSHLRRLPQLVEAKRRNISRLMEALVAHPGVTTQALTRGRTMGGWYDAVVAVDPDIAGFTRADLVDALCAEGVKARVPRTGPLHVRSVFRGDPVAAGLLKYPAAVRNAYFSYGEKDFPRSSSLHDSWVSLPATYFNDDEGVLVQPYVHAIERALSGLRRKSAGSVAAVR